MAKSGVLIVRPRARDAKATQQMRCNAKARIRTEKGSLVRTPSKRDTDREDCLGLYLFFACTHEGERQEFARHNTDNPKDVSAWSSDSEHAQRKGKSLL